jgi:hypothetical protein
MAIQLREPFFLRGRRNVLLRAIWMSLALGLLSGGAGLAAMLAVMLMSTALPGEDLLSVMIGASAAVALAAVVGIPYFRWRGDSARRIATGAGCIILIGAGPLLLESTVPSGPLELASAQVEAWKGYVGWDDMPTVPFEVMFGLMLQWLAWGAACFRRAWTWLLTLLVSGLSISLWTLSTMAVVSSVENAQDSLPGEVFMVLALVAELSIPGQFFAALVIPWGAPFWWPLETEVPPQVELA